MIRAGSLDRDPTFLQPTTRGPREQELGVDLVPLESVTASVVQPEGVEDLRLFALIQSFVAFVLAGNAANQGTQGAEYGDQEDDRWSPPYF